MAGYQRVGWPELAVVQMQIRPADPGNQDAEQHLTRAGFGEGNLAYRELARPVLDHGLHRVYLCTPGRVDSREAMSGQRVSAVHQQLGATAECGRVT